MTEYNTSREQFPANLVANMFGFAHREEMAIDKGERAAIQAVPAVKF